MVSSANSSLWNLDLEVQISNVGQIFTTCPRILHFLQIGVKILTWPFPSISKVKCSIGFIVALISTKHLVKRSFLSVVVALFMKSGIPTRLASLLRTSLDQSFIYKFGKGVQIDTEESKYLSKPIDYVHCFKVINLPSNNQVALCSTLSHFFAFGI